MSKRAASPASQRYAARVWRSFKRTPRAIVSFWIVVSLAVLALGADLIANDKPFYIHVDGATHFPIARSYGVSLGVVSWPEELRNVDFYELGRRAESVLWPPIPYSPTRVDIRSAPFQAPSGAHWLGTDHLGRDIAAGMLHGTRISLTIGLVVVAIQASIGIALGGLAGYYGGWVDLVISRLIELMLGIPTLFLLITVAAIFPPSIYMIMVILGLLGWTGIARYVRSEFLRLRAQDFVEAARSLGGSDLRVMVRHVLPNSLAPVLVAMSFGVASAILAESGLSFLGIGVPAHLVTWGSILSEARSNTFAWWLAVFPGAAIFLTVTVYNLMGDGLRDALDPKIVQTVETAPAKLPVFAEGAADSH
jgi:peptide/nickel transport system permease protein